MIVDLDEKGWAHVWTALALHAEWCRDRGYPMPREVRDLLAIADRRKRDDDRERQGPTFQRALAGLVHAAGVTSELAVSYAVAARRLDVSKRTVERLIESGALRKVDIGSSPRIRVADLEAYVAGLQPAGRSFRGEVTGKDSAA